jgi:hypothetical protein
MFACSLQSKTAARNVPGAAFLKNYDTHKHTHTRTARTGSVWQKRVPTLCSNGRCTTNTYTHIQAHTYTYTHTHTHSWNKQRLAEESANLMH